MHVKSTEFVIDSYCSPFIHRRHCPSVITTNENDLYTKPRTQLTLLLKPKRAKEAKKAAAQNRTRSKSQADPSWLYPILLPSIFPTLFCLYKAHHVDGDLQLRIAMSTLQQRTDRDLCDILDIKRYFYNEVFHNSCT